MAHVYRENRAMDDALEANIEEFFREIPTNMLMRIFQNWSFT